MGIIINHYKDIQDIYSTTSIMESERVFFVAQLWSTNHTPMAHTIPSYWISGNCLTLSWSKVRWLEDPYRPVHHCHVPLLFPTLWVYSILVPCPGLTWKNDCNLQNEAGLHYLRPWSSADTYATTHELPWFKSLGFIGTIALGERFVSL